MFGERWQQAVLLDSYPMRHGIVQSVGTTIGVIYQAVGKPHIQLRMACIPCVASIIALAAEVDSVCKASRSLCGSHGVWVNCSFLVAFRLIRLPLRRFYAGLAPALVIGAAITASRGAIALLRCQHDKRVWLISSLSVRSHMLPCCVHSAT